VLFIINYLSYYHCSYQKIRGQNQRGVVPSNYICYKCQKRGHWIKDCPAANSVRFHTISLVLIK
jgi:hypothetical protein